MIVVADASVLVAELVRARGRALLRDPRLEVAITEEQRSETNHEVERRLRSLTERGRIPVDEIEMLQREIEAVIDTVEVVPRHVYDHLEVTARRRVPRDPTIGQQSRWRSHWERTF